jgi:ribonuclease HII
MELTLNRRHSEYLLEAGCDEAGRGCLAGPVFAAAVILPDSFRWKGINDSKLLSPQKRDYFREKIEAEAIAWAVAMVDNHTIDEINILNASIAAMHLAIEQLKVVPEYLLIDGNRFKPYKKLQHFCVIRGDKKYLHIAAASILAKTHRDEYMRRIHEEHPNYGWEHNKGYPTPEHRLAIATYGITGYHRKSFRMGEQLTLLL